jgi:hypothetical protein
VAAAADQPVEQPGQQDQTAATAQTTTPRQEMAQQTEAVAVAVAVSHRVLAVSVERAEAALSKFE